MTKSKEVTTVENKNLSLMEGNLSSNALAAFGEYDSKNFEGVELDVADNRELFSNDIVVPKLWLVQAMSELRKQKKNDEGDYVNSRTEETLLSDESKEDYIPVVVLKTFKRWQTFKQDGDKKVFVSSEIMEFGKNHDLQYKETVEGEDLTRRQVISAYVLLGKDVQAGITKPYVVDFAATSKGAGRDLISDIKVLNDKKLPSYVAWFKLGREEIKEEHDYYVKTVKFGGPLPNEMMPFLKDAYSEITSLITANAIEIDDRDLRDGAKTTETKVNNKAKTAEARI